MPDESYAALVASYEAVPSKDKAKWKFACMSASGCRSVIRRDAEGFYARRENERVSVISQAARTARLEAARENNLSIVHLNGASEGANSVAEWGGYLAANLTGNHRGRVNHRVAVPTAAGQPTRG